MRRHALSAAAVALAVAAGCGSATIDAGELEDRMRSQLEERSGAEVGSVDCPDGREVEAGDTFDCEATVGGQPVRLKVTQRDDEGSVDFATDQAILSPARVAEEIGAQLSAQTGVDLHVDCGGGEVLVRDVGATFECVAQGPDETAARVVGTVLDTAGQFSFEVPGS